jgi:hypothetical protein
MPLPPDIVLPLGEPEALPGLPDCWLDDDADWPDCEPEDWDAVEPDCVVD